MEKTDRLYDSSDEDDTLDECITFYVDDISIGTIEDDFAMSTTCNDHDWEDTDNIYFDIENLFDASNDTMFDDNNYTIAKRWG